MKWHQRVHINVLVNKQNANEVDQYKYMDAKPFITIFRYIYKYHHWPARSAPPPAMDIVTQELPTTNTCHRQYSSLQDR